MTGDSLLRSLRTGLALAPSSGDEVLTFAFLGLRAAGLAAAGAAAAALDTSTEAGFAAASMEDFSAAGCRAMRRFRAGFLAAGLFVALSVLPESCSDARSDNGSGVGLALLVSVSAGEAS